MFAVLEDAIYCFQSYASAQDSIRSRLFLQAKDWLMEDDDDDWLFSFANICAVFGSLLSIFVPVCCGIRTWSRPKFPLPEFINSPLAERKKSASVLVEVLALTVIRLVRRRSFE